MRTQEFSMGTFLAYRSEALNRQYGLGSGTYKPAAMGWQEYRALALPLAGADEGPGVLPVGPVLHAPTVNARTQRLVECEKRFANFHGVIPSLRERVAKEHHHADVGIHRGGRGEVAGFCLVPLHEGVQFLTQRGCE